MSATDKVLDALRQTVLINERIEQLTKAVSKLEDGQVNLRDRVIRIEALIEFGRAAQLLSKS
ncbi:MAG TPA: hypothetical protein VGN24_02670 [Rhodanobacter sp.]|jgi:exonuclease VII small subunit|nr:hypothetical protein [Rhodanobacter sp.]